MNSRSASTPYLADMIKVRIRIDEYVYSWSEIYITLFNTCILTHGRCLLILCATNPYADTWMWLVILESEHILVK